MRHLFSWTQYVGFSAAIVALYYSVLLFHFYRKEIYKGRFSKNKGNASTSTKVSNLTGEKSHVFKQETSKDNLTSIVHEFVYELNILLKQLAVQKENKVEVMNATEKLINKYQTIKGSQFQPGLVNLVAAEMETICALRLNDDELVSLWK